MCRAASMLGLLSRRRGTGDEHGQALAIIVALIGLLTLLPLSVQLLATGQLPESTLALDQQDALQAAHAGLSDYVNHLEGPYSYLQFCSSGFSALDTQLNTTGPTTSLTVTSLPVAVSVGDKIQISSGTSGTQTVTVAAAAGASPTTPTTITVNPFTPSSAFAAGTPVFDMTITPNFVSTWTCPSGRGRDTSNPAFADYPDDANWEPVHSSSAAGDAAFQYVVNSSGADPSSIAGQRLVVYVTGRAGVQGRYVYSTLEVLFSVGPLYFSSSDCSVDGETVTVPSGATSAEVILSGAEGGNSSGTGTGGIGGGLGDTITVYPPVLSSGQQTWVVDPGMAGADGHFSLLAVNQSVPGGGGCSGQMSTAGGTGGTYVNGVATGNGGGGGGASAVCFGTTSSCKGNQSLDGLCTDAYLNANNGTNESAAGFNPCVIAIAGGGGGQGGLSGGTGGFWSNAGTYTGAGQAGTNICVLVCLQSSGGAQGTHPVAGGTSKGTWSSTTAYSTNQVVTYGASDWAALTGSTNVVPGSAGSGTVWAQVGYQGAWSSAVQYAAGQTVYYVSGSNSVWAAQKVNTNVTPGTDPSSWTAVSQLCGSTAGGAGVVPGLNLSLGLVSGGGGGGGGGWCGGGGGTAGGILGVALGTGGGGGVGGSAGMPDASGCPPSASNHVGTYPIVAGGGDNGLVIIAFFAGSTCPGDIMQYQATVSLEQPVLPNTA